MVSRYVCSRSLSPNLRNDTDAHSVKRFTHAQQQQQQRGGAALIPSVTDPAGSKRDLHATAGWLRRKLTNAAYAACGRVDWAAILYVHARNREGRISLDGLVRCVCERVGVREWV
jgi:hypothetical protein